MTDHGVGELRAALESIYIYLRTKPDETHEKHGEACGTDLCVLCLAESVAREALALTPQQEVRGERCDAICWLDRKTRCRRPLGHSGYHEAVGIQWTANPWHQGNQHGGGEHVQSGPPTQKKRCCHDSRRRDGWLDNHCLKCGVEGYWEDGSLSPSTEIHPSGKLLVKATFEPDENPETESPQPNQPRAEEGRLAELKAERDFLLNWTAPRLGPGLSSSALTHVAIVGGEPDFEPADKYDLEGCEETFNAMPDHLKERVRHLIERYRAALSLPEEGSSE